MSEFDEPIVVNGWVLTKALGEGGMGSVYLAHREDDPSSRSAVKVLDPDAGVSAAEERFRREAEVLGSLDHPGIARFLEYSDDPPILVMEFIEGRDLKTRLESEGAIPPKEAVHIARLVGEALTYLHARGVWHRDVKPANILVDGNGYIRLVDFGIAVEDDGASRLTQEGFFMGTLPYVPPEALDADPPDPASWDLYSLGVVVQEMLTGKPAFEAAVREGDRKGRGGVGQLLIAKDEWPYLDPGEGFDNDLRELVRCMTAKNAVDRISLAEAGRRMMALRFPDSDKQTSELPKLQPPSEEETLPEPIGDREPGGSDADSAARRKRGEQRSMIPLLTAAGASGATLLIVVALVSVALITVITVLAMEGDPPPPPGPAVELPRDVSVVVAGVNAETPLQVRLGEREPDERDGMSFGFSRVADGTHVVTVLAGEQCDETCIESACPCCATRQQRTTVGEGSGPLIVQLKPPAKDCDAEAELEKPKRTTRPSTTPRRTTPQPDEPEEPEVIDESDPEPEPVGPLVTHKTFAGFIRDNRKWDKRRAVAKGLADAGYLAEWDGSNTPVGKGAWPVVEVSFQAARAYCETRGGLARVDDGPWSWEVTPGTPIAELRELNGGPALRFSIGVISSDVGPETTDARFGFRCRGG